MEKTPKKKQLNKYIHLTGIAFQMGATIYVAAYLGRKLDDYFQNEKKICTLILILLGLAASIWNVLRQLKKINN